MTIPFVLLLNADRVIITTTMYDDVSGVRQVRTAADSSLRREVTRWTRDVTRGFDTDSIEETTHGVVVSRSTQVNDLSAYQDVNASATGILRRPFSFVTEYRWEESINIDFLSNVKEEAAAPYTTFEYRLIMPGEVQTASPQGEMNGRTVRWVLTADQEDYTLSATATALRWDLIILVVYIVGYLGYRLTAFLIRRARLKPRKI